MAMARGADADAAEPGERRYHHCQLTATLALAFASTVLFLHPWQAPSSSHFLRLGADLSTQAVTPRFLLEAVSIGKGSSKKHDDEDDDASSHPTISPADLQQAEQKLMKEAARDAERVGQAIRQRHFAEFFLKDKGNDIDLAMCEAASKFYQFDVLQELVKMGGSVNKQACGSHGGTCVEAAAHWGVDEGLTRIVKELGGDPNAPNKHGIPPIYVACNWTDPSHYATVRNLIKTGANVTSQKIDGKPLVVYAAERQQFHVTKCLLDNGANWPWNFASPTLHLHGEDYFMQLSEVPENGVDSALCGAVRNNSASQVLSYLVLGADIEYPWCWTPNLPWYTTPLGHAALHRVEEMVQLLVELGASRTKPSKQCMDAQTGCPSKDCFGCFSACEAFAARNDVLIPIKAKGDAEISKHLLCESTGQASEILRKQLSVI